jgi:hypothetical protein
MRSVKRFALSTLLTLGIASAVFYTSCSKDPSKSTFCFNNGIAVSGVCSCPKGVGGNNCEIAYRKLYANTYTGNTPGNAGHGASGNTLTFAETSDTVDYNNMTVTWKDTGSFALTFPIVLANNSSSGSSFTVTPSIFGSKTYTGGGTLTSTMASMSLTQTDTSGAVVLFTFNSFYKQ